MVSFELHAMEGALLGIFNAYFDKPPTTITWGAKHFVLDYSKCEGKNFYYVEAENFYLMEGHNARRVR